MPTGPIFKKLQLKPDTLSASWTPPAPYRPVLKSAPRPLGGTPPACIFGDQEAADSLCPVIQSLPGVNAVKLPGGHHFGGDYAAVAKAIISALPRTAADAGR
jgi:hypothetical protein